VMDCSVGPGGGGSSFVSGAVYDTAFELQDLPANVGTPSSPVDSGLSQAGVATGGVPRTHFGDSGGNGEINILPIEIVSEPQLMHR
jgi:hypothetical protein